MPISWLDKAYLRLICEILTSVWLGWHGIIIIIIIKYGWILNYLTQFTKMSVVFKVFCREVERGWFSQQPRGNRKALAAWAKETFEQRSWKIRPPTLNFGWGWHLSQTILVAKKKKKNFTMTSLSIHNFTFLSLRNLVLFYSYTQSFKDLFK